MKKKSIKYLATAVVSAAVIISGCGSTAGSQSSVSEQTAVQSEVASSSAESSSAAQAAASESTDTASVAASSTSVAESTTEAVNDDGWKEAFSDYITQRSADDSIVGYALINVCDNGIPSLVEEGDCEATGNTVLVYKDGVISETYLSRLGYSYAEKGNILVNSDGNTGAYYDVVYEVLDGYLVKTAQGEYSIIIDDDGNLKTDENGEEVYEYKWNGQDIDKDGYDKNLADAISGRQMISVDDVEYLDYDAMIAELAK